jgi:hypothetical protein
METLATAPVLVRQYSVGPFGISEYGLPFAWRYVGQIGFGYGFSPFLLVDVLFYMILAFIVITSLERKRRDQVRKTPGAFLLAIGYVAIMILASAWFYSQPAPFIP